MIDFKKKMEELEKEQIKNDINIEEDFSDLPKKKKRGKLTFYIAAFIALSLIFSGKVIMSSQNASDWFSEKGIFNTMRHLIPNSNKVLEGEKEERINILLLGMGGEGHDGAYLTDTIILASLNPVTKKVALISIPRDLTVPLENGSWRKINHVNALAEASGDNGGAKTISTLSNIFQLPIHYYIRIDFQGFINIIDELGGVEVEVENTLNDYAYPIFGEEDNPNYYSRYEHLQIEKGWQKMDGSLALKYARSRHAYGIEGSDFARARRQQLVIEALKDKLLSRKTLLNPATISRLIVEFNRHLSTNLEVWELLRLWDLFKDTGKEDITNKVLSDAPDGMLKSSISSAGAYILTPVSGNFGEIRTMMQNIIKNEEEEKEENNSNDSSFKNNKDLDNEIILTDTANIVIKNGTWVTGLAGETASLLKSDNLDIIEIGNAPIRDSEESYIYDFTYGNKNEILHALESITGASQNFSFPQWIKDYQDEQKTVDFVIVLGLDANN